jgi:dolichol-phosphate mannosyltransferase
LYRRTAVLLAPLVDVLAFCALIGAGLSLRASNSFAFAADIVIAWLLRWRAMSPAERPSQGGRLYLRILMVGFMGLFLRGGALALFQRWGWPPQLSILPTVALGLAVTVPGLSYASSAADKRPWRTLAFGLIAYSVVLRLVYAGSVELMPEEAYYWNYSRHLDFGYLDHPPMVAWLIRLGTALFGQTEFGLHFCL